MTRDGVDVGERKKISSGEDNRTSRVMDSGYRRKRLVGLQCRERDLCKVPFGSRAMGPWIGVLHMLQGRIGMLQ